MLIVVDMVVLVLMSIPHTSQVPRTYGAKVVHGHSCNGNVKVRGFTPLALDIFVVIFMVFEL